MSKIKIFFICSGLGVINRGYESFTRECFDALKTHEKLDAYLFKGGGKSTDGEISLFNFPRFHPVSLFFTKWLKIEGYTTEQASFCLSLIPYLVFQKPEVVLVSDFILSTYLWHVRKFLNLKYKILFSNGAPNGPPFNRCDHVQQLLPIYYQLAIDGGTPAHMMSIVPYGIELPADTLIKKPERNQICKQLGLPEDATIILSVGAINDHHKRMSYLIKEFAKIDIPNSYLVILGQMEEYSQPIIELAKKSLPKNNYVIKSVPYEAIRSYYQCADIFVLASLNEGFGRVFLEALTFGLPIITHDAAIFHQVLEQKGIYLNLLKEDAFANFITLPRLAALNTLEARKERINYVREAYGWEALKGKYMVMIKKTASN